MFFNMDFRMTTLIYVLVFLCMYKDFDFFCKTVQMLSYKFNHVSSLIIIVMFFVFSIN